MKQLIAYRFGSFLAPVYGDGKLAFGDFTQDQKDLFTLNPTRPMPQLHWWRLKIQAGQTQAWARIRDAYTGASTNRIHVFTPPAGYWRYEDLTYVSSHMWAVNLSGTGPKDFVIAMEVSDPDASYIFDQGQGGYNSGSAVANPVFTTKDDGTFEASCSTSGATILVNLGTSDGWMYYDPTGPVENIVPGTVIKALGVKDGYPSSGIVSYTITDKLLTPTFIDKGSYINIISPNGATVAWQAKYTKNGGAEQTYNPSTGLNVASGDCIVAWVTDTAGKYLTSNSAQFDKA